MKNNYIDDFYKEKVAIYFDSKEEFFYFLELNSEIFKLFNVFNTNEGLTKEIFENKKNCLLFVYQKNLIHNSKQDGYAFTDAIGYEVLKFSNIKPKTRLKVLDI